MQINIYGKTKEIADKKLKNIFDSLDKSDIEKVWVSSIYYPYMVQTHSGDIYRALFVSDYCRGYKCDKAYIDKNISLEKLNSFVFHTLIDCKDENVEYF